MRKWGVLLLAAMLLTALTLGAGAEEFFAEESFGGEESFTDEGFFEEEFFAEEPGEGVTEEVLPEEPAEELEDRSVITITPDLEAGEWQQDEEDYWKVAPVLQAEGKGKGQIVLTWVQDLYVEDDGDWYRKNDFPSKDIKYYVYEINPNGVMTQVGKPVAIAKKLLTVKAENEDGDIESYTGYGATVTLKNVDTGMHTYIVRAEKQTKASAKSKLFVEEYGEASEPQIAWSYYDYYGVKNVTATLDNEYNEIVLDFVADYDLLYESDDWEEGIKGFEVKAEYTFWYYDDDKEKDVKTKGTSVFYPNDFSRLELSEIEERQEFERLGYKPKGKDIANPVVYHAYLPEHEIITKNGTYWYYDDDITIVEAKYSVRYIDRTNGIVNSKASSSNKLKIDDVSEYDLWKTIDADDINITASSYDPDSISPGHTVDIEIYPDEYATEYVLGGLKDNLSLIRNDTLEKSVEIEEDENGRKHKEVYWYYTGERRFKDEDAEWVLYNNKTKEIIEDYSGTLYIDGVEAAGSKTTGTITVQPKQNKSSGKKYSQKVNFDWYWKKAPKIESAVQSGDLEAQISFKCYNPIDFIPIDYHAPLYERRFSVKGFAAKEVIVDLQVNEYGDLKVYTSDPLISGEASYDDYNRWIQVVLTGNVKKAGKTTFTLIPIAGKEKGEKATATVQIIAAAESGAVGIRETDTGIAWRHINPNIVKYVVTINYSSNEVFGTKGNDTWIESVDRIEKQVDITNKLGKEMSVDVEYYGNNVLIEGFDKNGGRILTEHSLFVSKD